VLAFVKTLPAQAQQPSPQMGIAKLIKGMASVKTTAVTGKSIIMLTPQNGAHAGAVWILSRIAGASFTIQSSNPHDDRDVGWTLFEPK
jgi:hypothetical protein